MSGALPNGLGERGAGHAALGMFGPAIAGLIMHAIRGSSIKGTLGIRRPWRYYLIAVVAPALFVGGVILIDVGAGLGRFVSSGSLVFKVAAVLIVGSAVSLPLTIGEEYGWRGYLLPRLLPLGG